MFIPYNLSLHVTKFLENYIPFKKRRINDPENQFFGIAKERSENLSLDLNPDENPDVMDIDSDLDDIDSDLINSLPLDNIYYDICKYLDIQSVINFFISSSSLYSNLDLDLFWRFLFIKDFGNIPEKKRINTKKFYIETYTDVKNLPPVPKIRYGMNHWYNNLVKSINFYPDLYNIPPQIKSKLINLAINNDNIELLEHFFIWGSCDKDFSLFYAAGHGKLKSCQYFISKGASVHSKTNDTTPFYVACQNGHVNVSKYLIKCGSDLYYTGPGDAPVIYISAQHGHTDVIDFLLSQGMRADVKYRGYTPLYVACKCGHYSSVERLLRGGADVNSNDGDGSTPLFIAAQKRFLDIVKLLLSYKANKYITAPLHGSFLTPLYAAAAIGSKDIVEILILDPQGNPDLDYINYSSTETPTAFFTASQHGHTAVVKFLLDNGADIEYTYIGRGHNALSMASVNRHLDIMKLLIERGADINHKTNKGNSALSIAADRGFTDICEYLIENGANIESKSINGYTPLCWACISDKYETVELLCKNGANINVMMNDIPLYDNSSQECRDILYRFT